MARVPAALLDARERREAAAERRPMPTHDAVPEPSATAVVPEPHGARAAGAEPAMPAEPAIRQPSVAALPSAAVADDQLTLF